MGLLQDCWDVIGKGAAAEGRAPIVFRRTAGVFARKPVVGLAEEVVTHPGPFEHVERLRVSPETENFDHIDLRGTVGVIRQSFMPMLAPVGTHDAVHFGAESRLDLAKVALPAQRDDVLVEVPRAGGATTESVDFWTRETVKVVELHRRKR